MSPWKKVATFVGMSLAVVVGVLAIRPTGRTPLESLTSGYSDHLWTDDEIDQKYFPDDVKEIDRLSRERRETYDKSAEWLAEYRSRPKFSFVIYGEKEDETKKICKQLFDRETELERILEGKRAIKRAQLEFKTQK